MQSVLISINPKWCALIGNKKKVVEVRKTRPKLETPFKVYIYCTKEKYKVDALHVFPDGRIEGWQLETANIFGKYCNERVIGEFICDEITALFNVATTSWDLLAGNIHEYAKGLVKLACLTEQEIHGYANGKNCYAWHISQLKIYDEPKSLFDFCKPCEPHPECDCEYCKTHGRSKKFFVKPPQSWCYVEELKGVSR